MKNDSQFIHHQIVVYSRFSNEEMLLLRMFLNLYWAPSHIWDTARSPDIESIEKFKISGCAKLAQQQRVGTQRVFDPEWAVEFQVKN